MGNDYQPIAEGDKNWKHQAGEIRKGGIRIE
jgi:hypothetical protein